MSHLSDYRLFAAARLRIVVVDTWVSRDMSEEGLGYGRGSCTRSRDFYGRVAYSFSQDTSLGFGQDRSLALYWYFGFWYEAGVVRYQINRLAKKRMIDGNHHSFKHAQT